ncbi:MAG: hypothetical protein GXO55_11200 [Chloroflexi bacterium]|nr:hypothetical protein [Chloroflexota bacterium]
MRKETLYAYGADVLTLFRAFTGVAILYEGWRYGRNGVHQVAVYVILGWIADALDGTLARRSGKKTKLGRYDFLVDVFLTWATFGYLTMAGYIPWTWAVVYTLAAMLIIALVQRKSVVIVFMRPIDVTTGLIAFRYVPELALLFGLWLVGLGIVRWRRVKTRVRTWIRELILLARYRGHIPTGDDG